MALPATLPLAQTWAATSLTSDLWLGTDATCGSAQTPFSGDALTTALQGVELRVAFCANTGGWLGSYPNSGSAAAQYFNGTVGWSGPAVDFFRAVQLAAGAWHQGLSGCRLH